MEKCPFLVERCTKSLCSKAKLEHFARTLPCIKILLHKAAHSASFAHFLHNKEKIITQEDFYSKFYRNFFCTTQVTSKYFFAVGII